MIVKAIDIQVGDIITDQLNQNNLKIERIENLTDEKLLLFVGDNLGWGDSFWCKVNYDDTFEVERK